MPRTIHEKKGQSLKPQIAGHCFVPSLPPPWKNRIHPQIIFCKNRWASNQTLTDTQDKLIHDTIAIHCVIETRLAHRCGSGGAKHLGAQVDKQEHESLIMSINNEY